MNLGSLRMSTFTELRMVLECSLKEIFRVAVSDILDSVEGSLSEHQRKMQRIESENADLRRMLFQRNNSESPPADTGDNEEVITYTLYTMTSQNTFSSDESSRRKHEDRMRESDGPKHPIKFEEITVDPGHNVKTEAGPESSHATDLSKSPAPVQLTGRSMKPGDPGGAHGGSDVTDGSHETHAPQPPSSDLQQDCGGGKEEDAGLPVISEVYSIKADTNGLHDEHRTADTAACSTDTAALNPGSIAEGLPPVTGGSIAEASPPVTGDSAPAAPPPVPLPESSRPAPPRPLGWGTGGLEAGAEGSDVNSHTCASCGKQFRRAALLRSHGCTLRAKADAHPSQRRKHKRVPKDKRPYCGVCGKTFSNPANLRIHKRIHTGERPYSCGVCGKTFTSQGILHVHKRIHTGERPYCCSVCGDTFRNTGNLRYHKRIHTGERPYSCGVCGNAYIKAGDLRIHERIHTGERPLSCGVCGKTFSNPGQLRIHKRIHTGERPYSCSLCTKTFGRADNLKRHALLHTREKEKTYADRSALQKRGGQRGK